MNYNDNHNHNNNNKDFNICSLVIFIAFFCCCCCCFSYESGILENPKVNMMNFFHFYMNLKWHH